MSDFSNTLYDFFKQLSRLQLQTRKGFSLENDNKRSFKGLKRVKCFDKATRLIDVLTHFRYFQIRCLIHSGWSITLPRFVHQHTCISTTNNAGIEEYDINIR